MINLWPFQRDVVGRTRDALRRHRRVGLVMPTGTGKTACAAYIAEKSFQQLGKDKRSGSILYLVHRKELLRQADATMKEIGLNDQTGIIASGVPGKPWQPIQIASIPTITRRLDKVPWVDPKLIIIDEGHHATAHTWSKVVNKWPKAYCIFLTATPMRNDDTGLGDMMGELVVGPQIKEVTPEFLAPVKTFCVDPAFPDAMRSLKAQSAHQTSAVIAKAVENWWNIARDDKTIFFAVDIQHSMRIVEQLKERGVKAEHLDHNTPPQRREKIFNLMLSGQIQCISNVGLFTEGTDWPECRCVVLARYTGSFTNFKQMVGRAMRRKKDGGYCKVIDSAGNVYVHGMPDDDVTWTLEKGAIKNGQTKKLSLFRTCEVCTHMYPRNEDYCPLCGSKPLKPEVLEVDYELTEVSSIKAKKPTKRQISEEIKATGGNIWKLKKLGERYGYSHGWAYKMSKLYSFAWR